MSENFMVCPICGKSCSSLINGTCYNCWVRDLNNTVYYQSPQVWYECPDCHGRFTSPITNYDFTYQCPFCGRKMEGFHL